MNEIVFNKGMKVFSKLFVGIKKAYGDNPPLAFATPYEENAAGKKRQDTVVSWLGGEYENVIENGQYVYDENNRPKRVKVERNTKILDNTPRSGFKITDDIKRTYWGGGNVVWRIFDPYGYELEIQSNNLMALIQTCGIDSGGIIPGNCVWGRDAGVNILLHESSEEYKNALHAAETLKPNKKVPMKDRIVGGLYTMQTGEQGIYLGKLWVWSEDREIFRGGNIIFNDKVSAADIYQYKVQEPEQYEAVLFNPDFEKGQGRIVFFKSASLIRYDNTKYDIPDSYFKTSSLIFPLKSDRIVFTSREKVSVRYTTEPISKEDFDSRVKHISFIHFSRGDEKCFHSASSTYLFSSGYYLLKYEDQLYGGCPSNYSYSSSGYLSHDLIGPAILDKEEYNLFAPYRETYSYHNRSSDSYNIQKAIALPKFSSKEELTDWCTTQFEAGNIVNVVVESC